MELHWMAHHPATAARVSGAHISCHRQSDVPDEHMHLGNLPGDVTARILRHLPYEHIFQLKSVSKSLKKSIGDQLPTLSLQDNPTLTACYFFLANGVWQWAGFDPSRNQWRLLPPLTFLPPECSPDTQLFKEFLFCTDAGLVCMNLSKLQDVERLIVFNPLSQQERELPPLFHRRNPVLMHFLLDSTAQSYQIILAGSSRSGDDAGSKLTDQYDSRTRKWTQLDDVPGPAFAINEYQSGVHHKGSILCIGFVERHDGQVVRGILGFHVAERRWWTSALPCSVQNSTGLQLVENDGEVYLFSEGTTGHVYEHCIDRLEFTELGTCYLVNVLRRRIVGGKSLEVYPEYALVPVSEFQLCVFNTVAHTGEVFDVRDPRVCAALPVLPEKGFRGELGFFTLNPMNSPVKPRFCSNV